MLTQLRAVIVSGAYRSAPGIVGATTQSLALSSMAEMLEQSLVDTGTRFEKFAVAIGSVLGHVNRVGPMIDYIRGLLSRAERKSVEPIAALTNPEHTAAQHQSLLHFIGNSGWSDQDVLDIVYAHVLPILNSHGGTEVTIIDDTGWKKKGVKTVGVARQYCGQTGKTDNCLVAVTLSSANHHCSVPIACRLYLPKEWAEDAKRRETAHVPKSVKFMTKPQIALLQLRDALNRGIPLGTVLMDAGYGCNTKLRDAISEMKAPYVAGIHPHATVWVNSAGIPWREDSTEERPAKRRQVRDVAVDLPIDAWKTIAWRQGSCELLESTFARVRVHVAHGKRVRPEEWLLIEWPEGEDKPTRYWFSTMAKDVDFTDLVDTTKMRWRIERDYQEMKQEVGFSHYEGRGWRGVHHHATMSIAAYAFLVSERETIPPSGPGCARHFEKSKVS